MCGSAGTAVGARPGLTCRCPHWALYGSCILLLHPRTPRPLILHGKSLHVTIHRGISVNTHSSTQRLTWSCAWELRMLWLPRPSAVLPVHVFCSCWPENYAYGQNLEVCGVCSRDAPIPNPNFGTGDNESFLPYSHFIYVANLFI